ncbi:MAG: Hpt domain-containing protein [Oscillospiraceae bacterium]
MDTLLAELKEYGADVDGAMGRFLDDTDLYKTCFTIFLEDKSFEKLGEAIVNTDYDKIFEYAHTLKGVAGNMGITPIYTVLCKLVDALRNKDYSCLQSDYAEILSQFNTLKEMQCS